MVSTVQGSYNLYGTNLETNFLMASETDLLLFANDCQVGGSLGLTASDLALWIMEQDPSTMKCPDCKMGCWLALPCSEILAGTEANSGVPAN